MKRYRDRLDAGRWLGRELQARGSYHDPAVFALPRGGVPVAYEVAKLLHAPLDVFVVRKLGVPGHEELAMGAIAGGGVLVLNEDVVERLDIAGEVISAVARREQQELERREAAYRDDHPAIEATGRTAILVDDGLATGSTMRAAVKAMAQHNPEQVIVAVPVAAADTVAQFRRQQIEVVCPLVPEPFYAVGLWYEDFSQTTDEEIRELLAGMPA